MEDIIICNVLTVLFILEINQNRAFLYITPGKLSSISLFLLFSIRFYD